MIDCINFQREKYLRYKNSRLKYFLIHSKNEFHSDFHIFQRRASFRNSPRQIFLYLEIFVAKFFKFIFTLLRLASNVFNRLHYPEYLAQLSLDYVTRHSSSLIPSRRSRSNYSRPAGCRRVIQRERERERERGGRYEFFSERDMEMTFKAYSLARSKRVSRSKDSRITPLRCRHDAGINEGSRVDTNWKYSAGTENDT